MTRSGAHLASSADVIGTGRPPPHDSLPALVGEVRDLIGEAGAQLGSSDLAGALAATRALLDALAGDGPPPPATSLPRESPLSPAARAYVRAIHVRVYRAGLRLGPAERRSLAQELGEQLRELEGVGTASWRQ